MNKIICRRQAETIFPLGDSPLLNRIFSVRGIASQQQLDRTLKSLLPPQQLSGMSAAVELLLAARREQQKIVIVGDFDADGATSTALAVLALRKLGFQQVDYLVPNRFEQGYGLSVDVAKMALEKQVALLITVDNGVSSYEGVEFVKKCGVKVIITDHHLPPEQLPSADAIINPNLTDCNFPSKSLAGVGVTFYLMLAVRAALRDRGEIVASELPNFAELLDLVALGTIADVVPLDQNNRILAHQGLERIRAQRCRYGIQALAEIANRDLSRFAASDLGFAIGPRLNAAGRLDNMSVGVELLLADDMQLARQLAHDLDALNQIRKEIEQGMKLEALQICSQLHELEKSLPYAIALYRADWHQGVLGILASRIKDRFHRPVVAFTQDQPGVLKGSARSIEGLHIRDVLERIDQRCPGMILKFGGHAMAAGLSIDETRFAEFQQQFLEIVCDCVAQEQLTGTIWSDGELSPSEMNLQTAELIAACGPWGQAFPEPLFDGEFSVLQQRLVGGRHLKMLLQPQGSTQLFDAIAFNIDPQRYPDLSIKTIKIVYKLDINEFRGNRQLQLMVEYMQPS
ncbi:single-stranded-DNA-specific exonuclease RecJ [Testudinibacter aquarius]|uniref:Single-stranded-DNA-specific exonuclease RecJ n=1 Tax=Testudinibacter aquarius TaxID=1524974 RepID=A0A4R3YAF3_9PAST|nr:single-stranded-DNA-specific exonuclease RecJ [Testudinibacter aquarius]KAE9527502.1 single-stranded-DNA-specific exonuclease RecJ [Testudinibacter aquarius]TCV88926.1 exonuclease RecJ [Testudinibacter aquarius]TNG92194.1 single-stranded-DNA-specific exonuclease RecJ [Testudinibacter aquarius]